MASASPFYGLASIQTLFAGGDWDFVNEKARRKFTELGWTEERMMRFVSLLCPPNKDSKRDFVKPYPKQQILENTAIADADAYKMYFDEENLARGDAHALDCCFFIKLAILSDENGVYAGITSFHTDEFK
jgi:hypothetical protein